MTARIEPGTPQEARALLEASHALMQSLFPAESNHYLSLDELAAPHIRFLVAREAGVVVGCGALAVKAGYGEVKSMFTAENERGRGVGDAMMTALVQAALSEGLSVLRLETGNTLHGAHRLYECHGFTRRGPFGDYTDDPLSVFYEKAL